MQSCCYWPFGVPLRLFFNGVECELHVISL